MQYSQGAGGEMKKKSVTVMWMPSEKQSPRILLVSQGYLFICLGLLILSWLFLGIGGYLGHRLYSNSAKLRKQNADLAHKVQDLDVIRHTIEQIQKDESIIRDFLGLDDNQEMQGTLGQGGEPSPDLSTVALTDLETMVPSPAEVESQTVDAVKSSLVKKTRALQRDLRELVEAMWDQRQILDSTPSIVPVKARKYWFSSGFGWRRSPFTGAKEFHNGLDICSHKGAPIVAPADGVVYRKGNHRYLGKYIRINHGRGVTTTYGHLSEHNVRKGQRVKRGEIIAFMGNTGRSAGTHLHYSVKVNRKYVNPFHYILNTTRNRLVDFSG
jgi:murein DD-endopeptidase MepM/ murein hydrolase activator NlpD